MQTLIEIDTCHCLMVSEPERLAHSPSTRPGDRRRLIAVRAPYWQRLEVLSYRRFGVFELTSSPGRRNAGQGPQKPRLAARTAATISSSPSKSTQTASRPNANSSSSSGSPVTVTGEPLPTATTA